MKQKLFTRNFLLLVLGQVTSLFGNLILKFALSMYVLETTGSAAIFAGILAVATVPTILLSPLGGILADRANRRNIMVALDALSGISVLGAFLFFSDSSGIPVISVLLVLLSVLGAFESPTVQAAVPQMQEGDNIVRGNAVVNQVAAIASLAAPVLGSMLYVALGLKPVMLACILCFFLTALFECFIKLEYAAPDQRKGIGSIVKNDFIQSMRFMGREQPGILKLLLLSALLNFFVMGTVVVGFPYIVRNILGLNAEFYGAAESILGVAALLGSLAAGLLTGKLKTGRLSLFIAAAGACLIPAGIAFLLPMGVIGKYAMNLGAFCGVQIAACIFSIFALSMIQRRTPNHLLGKVMSYVATISLCAQPIGQAVYGLLFDQFSGNIFLVLIPTGAVICAIGIFAIRFFRKLESEKVAGAEENTVN